MQWLDGFVSVPAPKVASKTIQFRKHLKIYKGVSGLFMAYKPKKGLILSLSRLDADL